MDALEGISVSGPMIKGLFDLLIGNGAQFNDFVFHGGIIDEDEFFCNTRSENKENGREERLPLSRSR
jgi:hypothetical protein